MQNAENPIGLTAEMDERREMPRCSVDVPATLVVLTQGTMLVGRMTELSLSGCRVLLPKTLSRATLAAIECTFKIRGVGFRLGGVVEWAESNGVGLQFNTMSSRCRDDLAEVLCEVELENNARIKGAVNAVRELTTDSASHATEIDIILAEVAARNPALPRHNAGGWNPFAGMAVSAMGRNALNPEPIPPGLLIAPPPAAQFRDRLIPAESSPAEAPGPVSAPQIPASAGQAAKPANWGRDRRASHRCGVDTSAIIDLVKAGSILNGHIIDLSVGGCRIKTAEKFPVGIYTRIETEFKLHGLPFRLGGVIQAIHDRNTVGIRFLDMSERKKDQVAELVAEMEERDNG